MLPHLGSTGRPVVTFTPDWKKILSGDSITMTCNVKSAGDVDLIYQWLKDDNLVHTGKTFTIPSAKKENSGDYQCLADGDLQRSETARLDVIYDWVTLQTPLYVQEGEDFIMKCHHYPGRGSGSTIFYKDDAVIQDWSFTPLLHLTNANTMMTGRYKCRKEVSFPYRFKIFDDEASIYIQEMFSLPELKGALYTTEEGDHMILTCHTRLTSSRERIELQFAFYRDGEKIQESYSHNQYVIQSIQSEHSGNYSCEARATTKSLIKTSPNLLVQMQVLATIPELKVSHYPLVEGDQMSLKCYSPAKVSMGFEFAFYKDKGNIQTFSSSNNYEIKSAQLQDSGNYSCQVKTSTISGWKRSQDLSIYIQELFQNLQITLASYQVIEGYTMILLCDTSVSLLKSSSTSRFAFYKDGQEVQGLSSSNKYQVQTAQRVDSGNYSCEVRNREGTVIRRTGNLYVLVEDKEHLDYSSLNVVRLIVSGFILSMAALLIHCEKKPIWLPKRNEGPQTMDRDPGHRV